jgi:hypothetical protein
LALGVVVVSTALLLLGLFALGVTLHDRCCEPDAAFREGDFRRIVTRDAILMAASGLAPIVLLRRLRRRERG